MFATLLVIASGIINPALGETPVAAPRPPYRVEAFGDIGSLLSFFQRRGLPANARLTTEGYDFIGRLMWHPDHLLAVGLLTGFLHIVDETFTIPDSNSNGPVRAWLSTIPIMLDVSMQSRHTEFGAAIGGYLFSAVLKDGITTSTTRLELGTIFHADYRFDITNNLSVGPGIFVHYMSYRRILSFSPHVTVKLTLLSY